MKAEHVGLNKVSGWKPTYLTLSKLEGDSYDITV